jgi:transglutaminase-like putative cysteine protease
MSEFGEGRPLFLRRFTWVMATLVLALLPHMAHLPIWATIMFLGLGMYRLAAARWRWKLPGLVTRLFTALIAIVLVLFTYRTLNGQEAGTALLVVMVGVKFLETVSRRDLILLVFMGYFLVASTFLYTQSIPVAILMIPTIIVITATLLQITRDSPRTLSPKQALRESGRLLAQALPLMLILFVLFPRIPGPLWGLTARSSAVTGLSDSMRPGEIAQLSQSSDIAFRVRFEGAPPPRNQWYWRGPILHNFDGRGWSRGVIPGNLERPEVERIGEPVTYTVTIEPHQRRWMFAMDLPGAIPSDSRLSYDYLFWSRNPIVNLRRYEVTSYPQYRLEQHAGRWARDRDRALPRSIINPRTRELGAQWREESSSDTEIVARALAMFRQQPFVYTLQPPLMREHPADQFLFDEQRGFCEHYASAFTLLMRAAGLPARVVTGYQGGEFNPISEDYVVRQSDAHAWAEVWIEDQGWIRVDPTAWVAPDRIELGLADSLPEGETVAGLMRGSDLLTQIQIRWDAINSAWDEFILGYGPETQSALLNWLGFEDMDWRGITVLLIISMGLFVLWLGWRLMRDMRPAGEDPALKLYRRFLAKLAKHGVEKRPSEGPSDFAQRASDRLPELAHSIHEVTAFYLRWRYHSRRVPQILRGLRRAVGMVGRTQTTG